MRAVGPITSNAWPQSRAERGATLRAIEQVLGRFPFFEDVDVGEYQYGNAVRFPGTVRKLVDEKGIEFRVFECSVLEVRQAAQFFRDVMINESKPVRKYGSSWYRAHSETLSIKRRFL